MVGEELKLLERLPFFVEKLVKHLFDCLVDGDVVGKHLQVGLSLVVIDQFLEGAVSSHFDEFLELSLS